MVSWFRLLLYNNMHPSLYVDCTERTLMRSSKSFILWQWEMHNRQRSNFKLDHYAGLFPSQVRITETSLKASLGLSTIGQIIVYAGRSFMDGLEARSCRLIVYSSRSSLVKSRWSIFCRNTFPDDDSALFPMPIVESGALAALLVFAVTVVCCCYRRRQSTRRPSLDELVRENQEETGTFTWGKWS